MALLNLRRRVWRALAHRLRAWSAAALRRAGGEPLAAPAFAGPPRSGPPAQWLARARPSGPPAHWLARVRQSQAELGEAAHLDGAAAPPAPEVTPESAPSAATGSAGQPATPTRPEPQAPPASTRSRGREGRVAPARLPIRLSPVAPRTPQQPRPETVLPEETRPPAPPPATPLTTERRLRTALPTAPRPARTQAAEDAAAIAGQMRGPRREAMPEESPAPHDAQNAGPAPAMESSRLRPTTERRSLRVQAIEDPGKGLRPHVAPFALSVQPSAARDRASVPALYAGPLDGAIPVQPEPPVARGLSEVLPVPTPELVASTAARRLAQAPERVKAAHRESPALASESWPALRADVPAVQPVRTRRRSPRAAGSAARRRAATAGRWPKLPGDAPLPASDDALESLRAQARLERLDREQRGL